MSSEFLALRSLLITAKSVARKLQLQKIPAQCLRNMVHRRNTISVDDPVLDAVTVVNVDLRLQAAGHEVDSQDHPGDYCWEVWTIGQPYIF